MWNLTRPIILHFKVRYYEKLVGINSEVVFDTPGKIHQHHLLLFSQSHSYSYRRYLYNVSTCYQFRLLLCCVCVCVSLSERLYQSTCPISHESLWNCRCAPVIYDVSVESCGASYRTRRHTNAYVSVIRTRSPDKGQMEWWLFELLFGFELSKRDKLLQI